MGSAADQAQGSIALTTAQFKAWRIRLSLTQRAAAEALGISERAVIYYEKGERPISDTVALLCKCLVRDRKRQR